MIPHPPATKGADLKRPPASVWLISLQDLDADSLAIQLGEVALMELLPGQSTFVGDPLRMALAGLAEDSRFPYVIEADGYAVGVLTLQSGAAGLAGWPDQNSAWLLRGFLIDRRHQGQGLGPLAAASAVETAAKLTARLGTAETGVVLSVNEGNPAGRSAYRRAGFEDRGQYLGGSSGPQRIMYRVFGA
ncbi:GNAT family N-acetyltransferase [Arthrobacter sp. HMWF013]|uniref:GNAT family N-acetyltransferase n=1 Tax=Arthrobacter sp. HMWF013 TaxID=2056849 RepID=UPI000D3CCABD|nr:GNAT family N-acetyltransferase [Arthrobacter sp. HMWF013]PTT61640.1 GNAT family N-acetyltransferase [Arthrobacter sp. HMWF013]